MRVLRDSVGGSRLPTAPEEGVSTKGLLQANAPRFLRQALRARPYAEAEG